jgi:hypothetical protein
MMLASSGESGEPWGAFLRRLRDAVHHDAAVQRAPNESKQAPVTHLARHSRHQHVVLDAVKEPLQIDVNDPGVPLDHECPGGTHRLMGTASGTEPVAVWRELRIEDRRERLRDSLLDQSIQRRGHAQLAFPTVGLGDRHPAHGSWSVRPRIEGAADFFPVLPQPRPQLVHQPAVHPGRTPVALDAL